MQLESLNIKGQSLWISPERSIYWETEQALIVSDLHFGKTGHFRKSGIAVPQSVYKEDLQRLISHIRYFNAGKVIIVGDLFHSHENKELDLFLKWRNDFGEVQLLLVKGNHDILRSSWYEKAGITVHKPTLNIGGFCFQHDPGECAEVDGMPADYLFSGHIHPGVSISGMGKQTLRFPCFYFSTDYCILPAFSKFTGSVAMEKGNGEIIYAIVNNTLIRI